MRGLVSGKLTSKGSIMTARIYQPARNAMQSGTGKTRHWLLEFTPAEARDIDPLMGWTGSGDMSSQVRMKFESKEAAVAYAEKHGLAYQLFTPQKRSHILRKSGYGDNFSHDRRTTWTH